MKDPFQELLRYTVTFAAGTDGQLFLRWTNVRRDLHVACGTAGIPPCSPNDLRRTCATWLRALGAPPDLIAGVLGHADTRMVERVYGRLPTELLRERLTRAIVQRCITGASDQVDQTVPVGPPGPDPDNGPDAADSPSTAEKHKTRHPLRSGGPSMFERDEVPGPGIEPGTRGFSVTPRVPRGSGPLPSSRTWMHPWRACFAWDGVMAGKWESARSERA
jgi:hypothetical protein